MTSHAWSTFPGPVGPYATQAGPHATQTGPHTSQTGPYASQDGPIRVPGWPPRVPGWPLRVPLRVEKGVSPGVQKWEPKTMGKIYPTFMSLTVRLKLT